SAPPEAAARASVVSRSIDGIRAKGGRRGEVNQAYAISPCAGLVAGPEIASSHRRRHFDVSAADVILCMAPALDLANLPDADVVPSTVPESCCATSRGVPTRRSRRRSIFPLVP